VGKSLNSVGVLSEGSDSPESKTPAQCFGTDLGLGCGRNFTDVTTNDASGNHQTFLQALTKALESIFSGNSLSLPSMRPGSFKFDGFDFEIEHKKDEAFDLVLTFGPNCDKSALGKLEDLSKIIYRAVSNFNVQNRLSGSIQRNGAPIQINSTLLVDFDRPVNRDVQKRVFDIVKERQLGWSFKAKDG